MGSLKAIVRVFQEPKTNNKEVIQEIIRLANKARKEGVISLDPMLKKSPIHSEKSSDNGNGWG